MTFEEAVKKATTKKDDFANTESYALDRLTHAVVALAIAVNNYYNDTL